MVLEIAVCDWGQPRQYVMGEHVMGKLVHLMTGKDGAEDTGILPFFEVCP